MRRGAMILQAALAAAALWSSSDVRADGCTHIACGDGFFIDASPPACKAGSACSVTFTLQTDADHHVNDDYPAKFIANDAAGVVFLGTDSQGPKYFTKVAGDFRKTDEKHATLTVKFQPGAKGSVTIAGPYKFVVCTTGNCTPSTVPLSLAVNVQ